MKRIFLLTTFVFILYLNCFSQNRIDSIGHKQGLWINYYEGGNPKEIGGFKNNIKEGIWKKYAQNGLLLDSFYYLNGIIVGRSKHFNFDGDYVSGPQFIDHHLDSGMTIWGYWHHAYINEDSTYLSLYKDSSYKYIECNCFNKQLGRYDCVKFHRNKTIYMQRYFNSFDQAIHLWDTPWKSNLKKVDKTTK